MITELVKAFLFIFIAEMGDKTQILAMAFATQYRIGKVLIGVGLGSLLNHGLAVLMGAYLSNVIPINAIQIIAGFSFIGFGLWALKPDKEEAEGEGRQNFGPVVTVAVAFFIGELGDKTQLTAMTLATDARFPLLILIGTVLGMIVTSSFGIFIGSKLGEKIPEFVMKIASAGIFIFFGVLKLLQKLPSNYLNPLTIGVFFGLLIIVVHRLIQGNLHQRKIGQQTALREVATTLYIQAHQIKEAVDDICLGQSHCGQCRGANCLVGLTKGVLEAAQEKSDFILSEDLQQLPGRHNKNFDEDKVVEALSMTLVHYDQYGKYQDEKYAVNQVKRALEKLAFGRPMPTTKDLKGYYRGIRKIDKTLGNKVIKRTEALMRSQDG